MCYRYYTLRCSCMQFCIVMHCTYLFNGLFIDFPIVQDSNEGPFLYLKSERQSVLVATERTLRHRQAQRIEDHEVREIREIEETLLRIKCRRDERWKYQNPVVVQQFLIGYHRYALLLAKLLLNILACVRRKDTI